MKRRFLLIVLLPFISLFVTSCWLADEPEDELLTLKATPSSMNFPEEGGFHSFKVTTAYKYWWAEKGSEDWFEAYYNEDDTGVDVYVYENETQSPRSAIIYVYGSKDGETGHSYIEVAVSQDASSGNTSGATLEIGWATEGLFSPTWHSSMTIQEDRYAVYGEICIKTNQPNVKVYSNCSWVTVGTPSKDDKGIWGVVITIEQNLSNKVRNGIVTFQALNNKGKVVKSTTLKVTQKG
jgi:hypothetical protein